MNKESDFIKKVGERIVMYRKAKNYRQIDLSDMMGIEDSALGRIERGETNPTLKTLIKIADALEIKVTDIVNVYNEF